MWTPIALAKPGASRSVRARAFAVVLGVLLAACAAGDNGDPQRDGSRPTDGALRDGSPPGDVASGPDARGPMDVPPIGTDGGPPGDGGPDGGRSDEICFNGLDDNGDGQVDERCACLPGEMQRCYLGPAARAGI